VNAAPPEIAKAGTRFTYRMMSATLAGEGSTWTPNDQGVWENSKGDRFDRQKKEGGGSSDTFEQYDLIAIDDKQSILVKNSFMISPNLSSPSSSGVTMYMTGTPGYGTIIWANTDTLNNLPTVVEPTRRIVRGQWRMGNGMTDAITMFDYSPTNKSFYAYDLKSGLMLESSISSQGPPSEYTAPGETNTGSTMLVSTVAVGARPVNIPWAGDPEPEWASSFKSATYSVSSQFGLAGAAPLPPTNSKLKFTVDERGTGWTRLTKKVISSDGVDPTAGQPMPFITTPTRLDPLWISPTALGRLQAGQTIDTDEYTKMVVRVAGVQQGNNGSFVVIQHTNGSQETKIGYDTRTGMMVYFESYSPTQHTKTVMTLDGTE
jgi:hypothetical protein